MGGSDKTKNKERFYLWPNMQLYGTKSPYRNR